MLKAVSSTNGVLFHLYDTITLTFWFVAYHLRLHENFDRICNFDSRTKEKIWIFRDS